MSVDARKRARQAVIDNNPQWPENQDYNCVGQQDVGPFTIYTVEFWSKGRAQMYHNFAVGRGEKILSAHYHLQDAIAQVDRGLGWRSLFIGQYTTVIGSLAIFSLVLAVVYKLVASQQIDERLWVVVAAGTGYLFGAKPEVKLLESPKSSH
jgi:hypothetical protein